MADQQRAALTAAQDLSRNDLTSECCEELAEALRANKQLRTLDLATCRIGDEGALMLADALSVRTSPLAT